MFSGSRSEFDYSGLIFPLPFLPIFLYVKSVVQVKLDRGPQNSLDLKVVLKLKTLNNVYVY